MPIVPNEYRIKDLTALTQEADLINKNFEVETAAGTDNNYKVSFPTVVQAVANNIPGGNNAKVAIKTARCYDATDGNYSPGNDTLVGLNPAFLCLHTRCYVEFPHPSRTYLLIYDGSPQPALTVWLSGTFTGQKIGAKWVEADSVEARTIGVPDFSPFVTQYNAGDTVKYTVNGDIRIFTAKTTLVKSTFAGNQIPAPTGLTTDVNWQQVAGVGSAVINQYLPGAHKQNEVVVYNYQLWQANENRVDTLSYPDPLYWDAIGGSGTPNPYDDAPLTARVSAVENGVDYAVTTLGDNYNELSGRINRIVSTAPTWVAGAYVKDQLVTWNDVVFKAKQAIQSSQVAPTITNAYWLKVSGGGISSVIPSFSGSTLTITTELGAASVALPASDVTKAYVDAADTSLSSRVDVNATSITNNTNSIGALNSLNTTVKTNLVNAVNEVKSGVSTVSNSVGNLSFLNTTNQSSVVNAINEVQITAANVSKIGSLTSLNTVAKSTLVAAVNELNNNAVYQLGTGAGTLVKKGWNNFATDYQSAVLAGESSQAVGQYSTVFSGYLNYTRGHWSSIIGGRNNDYNVTVNGNQAFGAIIGSYYCTVNADLCFVTNSYNCTIASGCNYTTLIGCTNLNVTTGSNQTYINNVLVGSSSGGGVTYTAGSGIAISAGNVISTTTSSGTSIDYTNPTTLSANTTLTAADFGKHFKLAANATAVVNTLTLPPISGNVGKLISVVVSNTSAGMWALQGTDIDGEPERRLWKAESAVLQCTDTGWTKIAGKTVPMMFVATFSAGSNAGGLGTFLFDTVTDGTSAPSNMYDPSIYAFYALRKGKYQPAMLGYMSGGVQQRPIEIFMAKNGNVYHSETTNSPAIVTSNGNGGYVATVSTPPVPLKLNTNEYVTAMYYSDNNYYVNASGAIFPKFSLTEIPTW